MPLPNYKIGADRHPEKRKNSENKVFNKPEWIRVKAPSAETINNVRKGLRDLNLVTVCEEAACPNIGECWNKGHATMMILGSTCTRACAFCNVATGKPDPIDTFEPYNVAKAVMKLNLRHVVITSVDRDDLKDGGAQHFANTIKAVRKKCKNTTIEVLTPDFLRKNNSIEILMDSKPDVFNHNLETVPSLYRSIRPGANYEHSLAILKSAKLLYPNVFTKSGIMLGLGESNEEVVSLMDDLREANVDFITIGQYLQPTPKHAKVERFVSPKEFSELKDIAFSKGFLMISSSPLTRSSYHADDDFDQLKQNRSKFLSV